MKSCKSSTQDNYLRPRFARRIRLLHVILVSLAGFSALPAQETNNESAPAAKGETVKLPPFVVDARKDTGYAAQNTMSGTRLNSPIADLGVNMTILTPEVWSDLALSSTNDLVKYAPGAQMNYNNTFFFGDAVKMRGILVENILRNSYKTNIPNDSYNAERMEFNRGPNSILVNGSSTTGGINRTTAKGQFQDMNRILFRLDEYGTTRTEFDVNREIIDDKLSARFITLQENAKTWRNPVGYKEQQRYYGAIKWRPIDKVTIDLTYEKLNWARSLNNAYRAVDRVTPFLDGPKVGRASNAIGGTPVQPTGVASFSSTNTTMIVEDGNDSTPLVQNWKNYAVGAPKRVFGTGFDVTVPAGILPDEFDIVADGRTQLFRGWNYNLEVQAELARNLYATIGFNREYMKYDFVQDPNASFLQIDASTTLPDGVTPNPNFGRYFMGGDVSSNRQDRNYTQHRIGLAYQLDFTNQDSRLKWLGRHDISFSLEQESFDNKWDRPRLINATPLSGYPTLLNNAQNRVRVVTYLDVVNQTLVSPHSIRDYVGSFGAGLDSQFLNETAGDTNNRRLRTGVLAWQSRYWDDRIVTTLGYRQDVVREYQAAPFTIAANGLSPDGHERGRVESANSGTRPKTKTASLVYHVIKGRTGWLNQLSVYANKSDAVSLLFPDIQVDGTVRQKTSGKTNDVGLRFQALDNRVSGSLTLFDTKSQNERFNSTEWLGRVIAMDRALGNTNNGQPADSQDLGSKGYDFQLTANLTSNWRVATGYSHFATLAERVGSRALPWIEQRKAIWLANPTVTVPEYNNATIATVYADMLLAQSQALAQQGSRTLNERRDKFTFLSHYAFGRGSLSGFEVGGDAVWTSAPNVAFGNKLNANNQIVVDPNNVFYGQAELSVGLHASYLFKKLFKKIDCRVQLNINNALNEHDPVVETAMVQPGTLQNIPVNYFYHIREPRSFMLTSTFIF